MINNTIDQSILESFIKKNSSLIYRYINEDVLKGIGKINYDYFLNNIDDIFFKNKTDISNLEKINSNRLPYEIFPLLSKNGKIDYTSLRIETINLNLLDEKASVYYNYVHFSIKEELLCLELMQTKIGGMPIDKDIIKFTKNIPIRTSGLEKFIKKNQTKINEKNS
jgi:hypothetical protein